MVEMLSCEWLDRLITVDRTNGLVRVRRLVGSQAHDRKYEQETVWSSQTLPPSKFVKFMKCVTVLDTCTGWTSPHLLVTHAATQSSSTLHELLVCNTNGSFEECGLQFEVEDGDLPSRKESEEEAYHLLDGPTVLWKRGAVVHIIHGPNLQQGCVTLQKPTAPVEQIRKMWCVRGKSKEGHLSILLMMQLLLKNASHCREFGERDWICLEVKLKDGHHLDFLHAGGMEATKTPNLIPADYGYIANCIAPYECSHVDESTGVLQERLGFVVGTEYRQVVLVEGGSVKYVISLPECPHHLVPLKGTGDDMEVGVSFSSGTTGVYEVTENGHKDRGVWKGVSECVTGDFAHLGHSQLLILPQKEHSSCFYLREPNILSVDPPSTFSDQEESNTWGVAQDAPESLLNVLKAIQLKKHTGEAQLIHRELSLQHKYSLFSRSLKFMESLGRDASSVHTKADPGLVCLIAGKIEAESAADNDLRRNPLQKPSSDLHVLRVWQRIMASEGVWVVAVLLRNDSQKILTGVGASLLTESGHTLPIPRESCSRVIWREPLKPRVPPFLAAAVHSGSPPEKKLRLEVLTSALESPEGMPGTQQVVSEPLQPNQAFCVGVVTEGVCPGVEAAVCGSWWREGSDEVQTGEWARVQLNVTSLCTRELSIDERCLRLWDGSLSLPGECKLEEREAQDLACLLSARSLTQVLLRTEYTYLSRLPSMIRARLPLAPHALLVSGDSFYHHHHHHHPSSGTPGISDEGVCKILYGIALHIQLLSDHAVVGILHRSQSDLQLVLKLLKGSLPRDVHLTMSESESSQQHALWQSLKVIREEGHDRAQVLTAALEVSGTASEAAEAEGRGEEEVMVTPMSGNPKLALATDNIVKILHA